MSNIYIEMMETEELMNNLDILELDFTTKISLDGNEDDKNLNFKSFFNWYESYGEKISEFLFGLSAKATIDDKFNQELYEEEILKKKVVDIYNKEVNLSEIEFDKYIYTSGNIEIYLGIKYSSILLKNINIEKMDGFIKKLKTSSGLYYDSDRINESEIKRVYSLFQKHAIDLDSFMVLLQTTSRKSEYEYNIRELSSKELEVTDFHNFIINYSKNVNNEILLSKIDGINKVKIEIMSDYDALLNMKGYNAYNRENGFGYKDVKFIYSLYEGSIKWTN